MELTVGYTRAGMTAAEPISLASLRDKCAHDLEWPRLLEHLAGRCLGPAAQQSLLARRPETTLDAAVALGELTEQALEAWSADNPPPVEPSDDVETLLGRVQRGAAAAGTELAAVGRQLAGAAKLRAWANASGERWPRLAAALTSPAGLDRLAADLERCLEPDGSVADRASPELARARSAVTETRKELGQRLGRLIRRYSEVLSDEFWTERDGRYVLPVRSDAHLKVQGIVLGSSASGSTLFVEPAEVTSLGNRLKVALAAVDREEARVLAQLSASVAEVAADVRVASAATTQADVLSALVSWARDTGSLALRVIPEARISLFGARHPLLLVQGVDVVENDIELQAGRALIISGPNAGGKTVALKCLGLSAWMARAGIPVPAKVGSAVGWFAPVLTDVGDEQSLLRSLSTFSAHVRNIGAIIEHASESALVLLDEVAAGTDPEEGAALAAAVLEELVMRGAAVAVTTHYERLKEMAADSEIYVNASVGFDLDAMAPTFRMTTGIPGASSALAVAARFGIPRGVVDRAKASVSVESVSREELLRTLSSESARLQAARVELERELGVQRELSARAEAERQRAREQERSRLVAEARELTTEVREARARLRDLKKHLARGHAASADLKAAEKVVNDAARHIAIGGDLAQRVQAAPQDSAAVAAEELVVGARVLVPRLGAVAEIVKAPERGQVRVVVGGMKMSLQLDEVRRAPGGAARPRPKAAGKKAAERPALESRDGFSPVRSRDNTLNLIGKRVAEAVDELDAFVDAMLRSGERAAFVLHGHGTGALKQAVRSHLAEHRQVQKSAPADPDDGGDAFTLFWLSD